MKFRPNTSLISLARRACLLVVLLSGTAFAQDIEILDKVRFSAVRTMNVFEKDGVQMAKVEVELTNSTGLNLIIKKGEFVITFVREPAASEKEKDKDKDEDKKTSSKPQSLELGEAAPIDEIDVPAGTGGAGKAIFTLDAVLGPKGEQTNEKMIKLFNMIAQRPAGKLTIVLDGEVKLGVRKGQAINFDDREMRFELVPVMVDEALFR